MAEKWLLTGGTGQVGLALRRLNLPGVEIVAPGRGELDLAFLNPLPLGEVAARGADGGGQSDSKLPPPPLRGTSPRGGGLDEMLEGVSAIINCAAYTAVDKAESEPELARAVNYLAPAALAKAAADAGIPIIHISTDYVFSANGTGPWREDGPVGPASVYGRTKALGEAAVRSSGARHAIIRTAWVISADGSNFVKTMLRLGAERDVLRVVADQRGCPTHAGDLAAGLAKITAQFVADPTHDSGTWHCTNAGETTWHGLAEEVFACAARRGLKVPTQVEAITTAEYPTPARRPMDSRLNCHSIAEDFGIRLRPWQEAVDDIVGQLAKQGMAA